MRVKLFTLFCLLVFSALLVSPQANERQQFIRVEAKLVALTHVRVIDGTGAAAQEDQTILIADGKIRSVGPAASTNLPSDAKTIDLTGYTVLPGLVGMHDHMF